MPKVKWNNIKTEGGQQFVNVMRGYIEDIIVLEEDEPQSLQELWNYLHEPCIERAENLLGVNRGLPSKKGRETWWWNGETKEAVERKAQADKKLALRREYDKCNRKAKRTVAKARAVAYKRTMSSRRSQ